MSLSHCLYYKASSIRLPYELWPRLNEEAWRGTDSHSCHGGYLTSDSFTWAPLKAITPVSSRTKYEKSSKDWRRVRAVSYAQSEGPTLPCIFLLCWEPRPSRLWGNQPWLPWPGCWTLWPGTICVPRDYSHTSSKLAVRTNAWEIICSVNEHEEHFHLTL